jgi:hypothetical protein
MKRTSLAIAACALAASQAHATVIATDLFNDPSYSIGGDIYPANPGPTSVYGPNDGTGWSTGWEGSGGGNVTSPRTVTQGLAYTGLATSGYGAASPAFQYCGGYCYNSTALRGFSDNTATTNLWVSFLIKDDGVAADQFAPNPNYAGFSILGSNDSFFIGVPGIQPVGTNKYSLQTQGANAHIEQSAKGAAIGQTDLLVADITASGTAYLYVDPIVGQPLGAPDATITTTLTPSSATGLYWTDSWGWTYADVRVGTTLADVTPAGAPEPAAWALVLTGLAGLGGALRSRRWAPLAA